MNIFTMEPEVILKVTFILKIYSYAIRFIPASSSILDKMNTRKDQWERIWNVALQSREKATFWNFSFAFLDEHIPPRAVK